MKRTKVAPVFALTILGMALIAFVSYAAHQYQRAKMKTTITAMSMLGISVDAFPKQYLGPEDRGRVFASRQR